MPITSFNAAKILTIDTSDDLATSTESGYFDGIKEYLTVGQIIFLTASDDVATLRVTAVEPSATVENSESALPANSVGTEQLKDSAVTNPKIPDGAIEEPKFDPAVQAKLNIIKASAVYNLTNIGVPGETVSIPGKGIVPGLPCNATCVTGSTVSIVDAITGTDEIIFAFNAAIVAGDKVSYTVTETV